MPIKNERLFTNFFFFYESIIISTVSVRMRYTVRGFFLLTVSHSRVKLKKLPHEEHSDYINANFITVNLNRVMYHVQKSKKYISNRFFI